MTLFLFAQPLAERFEQLVPTAEGLDTLFLVFGEQALRELLQPLRRQFRQQLFEQLLGTFEVFGKDAVEAIEVPFVLHECHARQVVELFGGQRGDARLERLEQREKFRQRHRRAGRAQIGEEADQHRGPSAAPRVVEEDELLEQMNVLFVLQERAVQDGKQLLRIVAS